MRRLVHLSIAACAAIVLYACGGGGSGGASGSSPAGPIAPVVPAGSTAHISITIPATPASTGAHRQYVSPNTQSIRIHVVSVNGAAPNPAISDLIANVTSSSGGCVTSASGVSCTLAMTLPGQSSVILQITTYDATGAAGNVLSTGTSVAIDTSVANPSVSISLGGSAASVTISPSIVSAIDDGATHMLTLQVTAHDASGATIVGPGNYVTPIALGIANDPNGALSLSQSNISAIPAFGSTTLTVSYNSAKALTNGQIIANGAALAAVNPILYSPSTLSAFTVGGGSQTVTLTEYGNSSPFVVGSTGGHITSSCVPASCAPSAPGGSVTFTLTPASGGTGTLSIADTRGTAAAFPFTVTGSTGGSIIVPVYSIYEYNVPSGSAKPGGITVSPDGKNLLFTEGSNQNIAELFPSTCVNSTPPSGSCSIAEQALGSGYNPVQITSAADGNVYALSNANSAVEQVQYSTCGSANPLTCTHAPIPGVSPGPQAIANDRNGNLLVGTLNGGNPAVTGYTVNTSICCSKPWGDTLTGATTSFAGLAAAGDGYFYATYQNDSNLYQLMCLTSCNVGLLTVNGNHLGTMLAIPPGALWIATATTPAQIAEVYTSSCSISCTVTASATAAGTAIGGMTLGSDGNLWFTDTTAGKVGFVRIGACSTTCPVTEFSLPSGTSALPVSIVSGPDGNIWFTEQGSNKIGRIML